MLFCNNLLWCLRCLLQIIIWSWIWTNSKKLKGRVYLIHCNNGISLMIISNKPKGYSKKYQSTIQKVLLRTMFKKWRKNVLNYAKLILFICILFSFLQAVTMKMRNQRSIFRSYKSLMWIFRDFYRFWLYIFYLSMKK